MHVYSIFTQMHTHTVHAVFNNLLEVNMAVESQILFFYLMDIWFFNYAPD